MAKQRESKWKDKLRDAFYGRYGDCRGSKSSEARMLCVEGSSGQQKGLPDRFFAVGGDHAWVEVKCDERRLEPLQRLQMWRLARAGQNVLLLRVMTAQKALYVSQVPAALRNELDVVESYLADQGHTRVFMAEEVFGQGPAAPSFWEWFWGRR